MKAVVNLGPTEMQTCRSNLTPNGLVYEGVSPTLRYNIRYLNKPPSLVLVRNSFFSGQVDVLISWMQAGKERGEKIVWLSVKPKVSFSFIKGRLLPRLKISPC